ncbi:hypothetical protein D3C75_1065030 [compost metagenome]
MSISRIYNQIDFGWKVTVESPSLFCYEITRCGCERVDRIYLIQVFDKSMRVISCIGAAVCITHINIEI